MPTIKKGIICEDENLQNKIYPYTQMDCVFDSDNSTTLEAVVDDIKENLMYVDEIGAYENVVPINADQLEGHDGTYYKQINTEVLYNEPNPTAQAEYRITCTPSGTPKIILVKFLQYLTTTGGIYYTSGIYYNLNSRTETELVSSVRYNGSVNYLIYRQTNYNFSTSC